MHPSEQPVSTFPFIRQLSYRVSPVLARLGLSTNQITALGLVSGLLSAILFARGTEFYAMLGAVLWAICCLMDYCDG